MNEAFPERGPFQVSVCPKGGQPSKKTRCSLCWFQHLCLMKLHRHTWTITVNFCVGLTPEPKCTAKFSVHWQRLFLELKSQSLPHNSMAHSERVLRSRLYFDAPRFLHCVTSPWKEVTCIHNNLTVIWQSKDLPCIGNSKSLLSVIANQSQAVASLKQSVSTLHTYLFMPTLCHLHSRRALPVF